MFRRTCSLLGLFALMWFIVSCSSIPLPNVFSATPTLPPTQIPLPTRVAIVVPTVTATPVLVPSADSSEAATMLRDFIDAVSKRDVEGALSYWNTGMPNQSSYEANVRKMIQEWIDKNRKLSLTTITYSGLDANSKVVVMPITDYRVDRGTAKINIDGIDYLFYLTLLKGGWFIEGVNTAK